MNYRPLRNRTYLEGFAWGLIQVVILGVFVIGFSYALSISSDVDVNPFDHWFYWPALITTMQLMDFKLYADIRRGWFLADLDWSKPTPWVLTFLLGPVVWLIMTLSYLRNRPRPHRAKGA